MTVFKFTGLIIALLVASYAQGQRGVYPLRIEDGYMIVLIDDRNPRAETDSVLAQVDLQWINVDSLFQFGKKTQMLEDGWEVQRKNKHVIAVRRPLSSMESSADIAQGPLCLPGDTQLDSAMTAMPGTPGYPPNSTFGYNSWKDAPSAFENSNGLTVFVLNGYPNAREVYLSGSFNKWSTLSTRMQRIGDTWTIAVPLQPGPHLYKFIVDGHWKHDESNRLMESDGFHGFNSLYFRCNHTFQLGGYSDAKKVVLSGSFNEWNERELVMNKSADGNWTLPVYLREGTYTYKFIVDKTWITDPHARINRPDGMGNTNSVLSLGDTLFFRLSGFSQAREVFVTGSFNGWNERELRMERTADGWVMPYVLAAGNFEYKFIADGVWMTDPNNPVAIGEGDFVNSLLVVQPNHTFRCRTDQPTNAVYISGSFNNWQEPGYPLFRKEDEWILPLHLEPGKYSYKFVINGKWYLDPNNPLFEENEYGTGNSFIWIE